MANTNPLSSSSASVRPQYSPLTDLPYDPLSIVLECLDPKSFEHLRRSCKSLKERITSQQPTWPRPTDFGMLFFANARPRYFFQPLFPLARELSPSKHVNGAMLLNMVQACPNLEALTLSEESQYINEEFPRIVTTAPQLKSLKIEYKREISMLDASNVYMNYLLILYLTRLPQLETLELSCNQNFTGQGIAQIQEQFPRLRTLKLTNTLLIDELLQVFLEKCPILERLDLSDNILITGDGIAQIQAPLPHLKFLQLSETSFSDAGLQAFLLKCPNIRTLNIMACVKLTYENIQQLQKRYPRTKFIHTVIDPNFSLGRPRVKEEEKKEE